MGGKTLIILFHVLVLWGTCQNYQYEEYYFTQKVDHFGYTNGDTFQQRYLVNLEFYNRHNSTIFFYTGNEGDITMFANNTGFMWENAAAFNAGLIFAEHRYYGKSLPYGKDSMKDNIHRGYLSSEQALADFASLIYYLKTSLPGAKQAPVIAIGGSYGGMLAAWIRIKYSHLVNGAVASSAPIFQFEGLTPCEKFSEIVTEDFKLEGSLCAKCIRRSWNVIRKFGKSEKGAKFLTETFKLCRPLYPSNTNLLVDWLSETWSYLAMTNYPYPTSFLNPLPANPIKVLCKFLINDSVSDKNLVENIFKSISVFHNYTGSTKCNDLNQSGGSSLGDKIWKYQECTEMVQPMCQTGSTDMFEPMPWNFTAFSESCWQEWNVKPDPSTNYIMYGGKNITASSNILFSNGKLDPWYAGGVTESLSDTLVAIVIENAAHHLDLRASNPADPTSVRDARQLIRKWISKWITAFRRN